jgi:hypothetical protein
MSDVCDLDFDAEEQPTTEFTLKTTLEESNSMSPPTYEKWIKKQNDWLRNNPPVPD